MPEQQEPHREMSGKELREAIGFYLHLNHPVLRLIDELHTIANEPRSKIDQRHLAEHSLASLFMFAMQLAPVGGAPPSVINALFALICSLADLDQGRVSPFLARKSKLMSRPTHTAETVWKGWAISVLEYWYKQGKPAGETRISVATRLADELSKQGACDAHDDAFTVDRLENFREGPSRRRTTRRGEPGKSLDLRREIESDDDARRLVVEFLAPNSHLVFSKSRED